MRKPDFRICENKGADQLKGYVADAYQNHFIINTFVVCAHYTPGIYADGFIVFVFPFVSLYVRS